MLKIALTMIAFFAVPHIFYVGASLVFDITLVQPPFAASQAPWVKTTVNGRGRVVGNKFYICGAGLFVCLFVFRTFS